MSAAQQRWPESVLKTRRRLRAGYRGSLIQARRQMYAELVTAHQRDARERYYERTRAARIARSLISARADMVPGPDYRTIVASCRIEESLFTQLLDSDSGAQ